MDDWFGMGFNGSVYALYAVFLLAACLINVFDIRITAGLNTISAYWHMAGVAFIVLVLIIVPNDHQSFGYVFGETVNASGYGDAADNFSNPAFWFVFGLWRLAWRPGYRRSWYGWLWPFLMWVNLCLVVPAIGH